MTKNLFCEPTLTFGQQSLNSWMERWTDGWRDFGCKDGQTDGSMDRKTDRRTEGWKDITGKEESIQVYKSIAHLPTLAQTHTHTHIQFTFSAFSSGSRPGRAFLCGVHMFFPFSGFFPQPKDMQKKKKKK